MALNYNLAKVYALSGNEIDFVRQKITIFITEIPSDLMQIKIGIRDKAYNLAYRHAHQIKPSLDLFGMTVAFEEVLQIETWCQKEGKRREIKATFESVVSQVEKAIKEIKKDFTIV